MHLEDYLNCAKMFNKVLRMKKDYYRAFLALGICYEKLDNPQIARRYYKKYLAYDKDAQNYKKIIKRINNLSEENTSPVKLRIV